MTATPIESLMLYYLHHLHDIYIYPMNIVDLFSKVYDIIMIKKSEYISFLALSDNDDYSE